MILDKYGSIKRLTPTDADADKEGFVVVSGLESFRLNIQPASAETVALSDGVFGKVFDVYTTHSGIKDGDQLTVSGNFIDGVSVNKTVIVTNVRPWSFGPLPHFEITCTETEE